MTTIRWTTTVEYVLHLDPEQQAEWDALAPGKQDGWLADQEGDDIGFDAVLDRIWTED